MSRGGRSRGRRGSRENRDESATTPPADADGPVVAVCTGHRCDALHRLAAEQNGVERLRETIAGCRGAVLVSAPCLGSCALGALAVVACRDGATGATGPPVWLAGMDSEGLMETLRVWIRDGGPTAHPDGPRDSLPTGLSGAVIRVADRGEPPSPAGS